MQDNKPVAVVPIAPSVSIKTNRVNSIAFNANQARIKQKRNKANHRRASNVKRGNIPRPALKPVRNAHWIQ
jgi:hypothetical protein